MRLTERDYLILNEVFRWRFLLGRHIQALCGFEGIRTCDRRLKLLIEAGYLDRHKIFYGVPYLYTLTHKGKVLLGVSKKSTILKVDQIPHDILVADTAVFLVEEKTLSLDDVFTEKELHQQDGFSNRKHCPDFVFISGGKSICVEVELSHKSKKRFLANLKSNYMKYDGQLWILPRKEQRNRLLIEKSGFTGIEIIDKEVIEHG